jgi:hypothetical protein
VAKVTRRQFYESEVVGYFYFYGPTLDTFIDRSLILRLNNFILETSSQTNMASTNKNAPTLLGLALETRIEIFKHVFGISRNDHTLTLRYEDEDGYHNPRDTFDQKDVEVIQSRGLRTLVGARKSYLLGILSTNKQISAEATELFYRSHEFKIYCESPEGLDDVLQIHGGWNNCQWIKRLRFSYLCKRLPETRISTEWRGFLGCLKRHFSTEPESDGSRVWALTHLRLENDYSGDNAGEMKVDTLCQVVRGLCRHDQEIAAASDMARAMMDSMGSLEYGAFQGLQLVPALFRS